MIRLTWAYEQKDDRIHVVRLESLSTLAEMLRFLSDDPESNRTYVEAIDSNNNRLPLAGPFLVDGIPDWKIP